MLQNETFASFLLSRVFPAGWQQVCTGPCCCHVVAVVGVPCLLSLLPMGERDSAGGA